MALMDGLSLKSVFTLAAGAIAGCMFAHTVMGVAGINAHMSFIVDPIREFFGLSAGKATGAGLGSAVTAACTDGCGLDGIAKAVVNSAQAFNGPP